VLIYLDMMTTASRTTTIHKKTSTR